MMDSKIKQVIVLRKDLSMRKGKMIAQGGHASMKVFFDRAFFDPMDLTMLTPLTPEMYEWASRGFAKIALYVNSEEELEALYEAAEAKDLPVSMIVDAGRTEFHGVPTKTAIAIGPAYAEDIDPITGHLKLL